MPYSILWISIWSYNTVYMKYVQNSWMPAFLVCFIYSRVLVAFLNFRIVKSVIFLGQKKKRPALNVFVISWTTPCQNSMSNLKLRAASPISGCGRGLAGPARTAKKHNTANAVRVPYTTVYITHPWGGFPSSIGRQPRERQYRTIRPFLTGFFLRFKNGVFLPLLFVTSFFNSCRQV